MNAQTFLTVLATTCLVVACSAAQDTPPTAAPAGDKSPGVDGAKADHWSPQDSPSLFSDGLEYRLNELPLEGEATNVPWASSYWPVYQDSLNHRWQGADSLSTAAKYGEAFGVEGIEDKVSRHHGIDKYKSRTACKTDDECNSDLAEACAKRHGAEGGFCIPTWWGICHAWAPAAILHPEPLRPVTRNGVTFEINDIKALVTLMNDKAAYRFVSLRCDASESQGEIEYDQWQRPTGADKACKDTNPGTYHVLLTNYLGLQGQSFVEDRTFDAEVWNQPLRGYRITEMTEVTAQQANQLVGVQPEGEFAPAEHSAEGTLAKDAWHHEAAYDVAGGQRVSVIMTGTHDADLYVRFDAQPNAEDFECRPWQSGSDETCELTVPADARQVFVSVLGYSEQEAEFSVETTIGSDDPMLGIPTEYSFNAKATSFRKVTLEVDYIAESESDEDGNLASRIDHYTRTDTYEYVLELDKDDKIHGGEWINGSKKFHPDFLWLPTGRFTSGSGNVAGGAIRKDMITSLLNESMAPVGDDTSGPKVVTIEESGSVAKGDWKHFGPFEATGDTFSASLTGSGDADLYVRKAAQPTSAEYECRPYDSGSEESCVVNGATTYYVSVNGYSASEFKLVVSWTEPGDDDDTAEPVQIAHLSEAGSVAKGEMKTFELDVVAGRLVVVTTIAAQDVDLYVRMHKVPTRSTYDQRGYTASGNETLRVMPTATGKLFIAVDGYVASDFELKTSD